MKYLIMILMSFVGTAAFAIIFKTKKQHILIASIGGTLTCAIYALFDALGAPLFLSNFPASLFAVVFASVLAKILKTPSTILVALCIIPLVPGSSLFYTMSNFIVWDQAQFVFHAQNTLQTALGIAGGIVLESTIGNVLTHLRKHLKKSPHQE